MPQVPYAWETALAMWSRRKWLALVVWVWTLGGAGAAIFALPDLHRATATVLVERRQVPEALVSSADTSELETRIHTFSQQILSRARLEEVITSLNLYPALRGHVPAEVLVERMRRDIRFELTESQPSTSFAAFSRSGPGENVTVGFRVSYLSMDPQMAARVTNTLASFYVDENLKAREEQASGIAQFLRVQVGQMKQRVEQQAAQLNNYKQRNTGELPELVEANMAALMRLHLQLQMNSERRTRALERRETLTRQVAEETVAPSPEVRNPVVARRAELQRRLAELRSRVTDKHPELVRIQTEIATLETQLAAAATEGSWNGTNGAPSPELVVKQLQQAIGQVDRQAIRQIDGQLSTLKTEEEQLRQAILSYERRIEGTPKRQQEFQELWREYEAAADLYYSLQKRYEDAHLTAILEERRTGERFRILDSALPPRHPIAPNRLHLLGTGLGLALLLAATAIALAEKLDTSFHSVDELRTFTRVPVAAFIPRIVTRADTRRRRWRIVGGVLAVACGLMLIAAASSYLSHGNEQLVRFLARGYL
jgi:succinoglycan biosynthesis transport protein ExoP